VERTSPCLKGPLGSQETKLTRPLGTDFQTTYCSQPPLPPLVWGRPGAEKAKAPSVLLSKKKKKKKKWKTRPGEEAMWIDGVES